MATIDPNIPLSVFANAPSFGASYSRALQLKSLKQRQKLEQMQIDEEQRKMDEAAGVRQAAASAVIPQQTQQVNIPGASLSTPAPAPSEGPIPLNQLTQAAPVQLPGSTDSLTSPASFDRSRMLSSLAANPKTASQVPAFQSQFAQQDLAQASAHQKMQMDAVQMQEALGKLDAQSRATFSDATEQVARASGAVLNAPPEMRPQVYQQALQSLAQNPNPMVQKMIAQAPQQYQPGMESWLQEHVSQGMAIKDIADRVDQKPLKPTPGVEVPFSPAVEAQKARLAQAGKTVISAPLPGQPGSLDDAAINQAAEMYAKTGQMPALGMGKAAADLRTQIMNRAAKLNPTADLAENKQLYGSQTAVRKDFTSGQASKALTSFATASHHLDTLEAAADALDSGNLKALNAMANSYHVSTGSTPIAAYKAIQQVVAGDVNKAIAASGTVAENEMQVVRNAVDPSLSTPQKKAAINALRELMNQKRNALKAQYDQGMKGTPNFGSAAPTHRFNPDTGKIEAVNAQ